MSDEGLSIYHFVEKRAVEKPDGQAVIAAGRTLSCRQLDEQSRDFAAGLLECGLAPGDRTVLMATPSTDFMVVTFGLFRMGAIPIFIDPGMGWKNLGRCLEEAEPEAFIGIPRAQLGRKLFGWARHSLRHSVTVTRLPWWPGRTHLQVARKGRGRASELQASRWSETAAIAFTSGSTGTPKGVVYTHRMFSAQARLLQDTFGIEPGEVDLATFPLFGLFDPAMKVTTVFPNMDYSRPGSVDPKQIFETIRQYSVTHLFGSPALLRRVGPYAREGGIQTPTIRRVLSAGAPVPRDVIETAKAFLPAHSEVFTPYGATEALPVTSISGTELLSEDGPERGLGVCVGKPLEGVNAATIAVTDDPVSEWGDGLALPPGEIGEIVVWGDNVSESYFRRPEADRLGKIVGPQGRVRHRMGDLGYFDSKGRIWFCGRKSHRVQTPHGVLYSVNCEEIFNAHPAVFRSALVGVGPVPRQRPVICVELEAGHRKDDPSKLIEEILRVGSSHHQTSRIDSVLFHPSFPVDVRHNSKIFREKLALWAEEQLR